MVPWMTEWAGSITYKFFLKPCGRTAYELATGHKVRHKVAAFGEYIHFKMATDESERNKFDGEWSSGYFAGVTNRSNEYLPYY